MDLKLFNNLIDTVKQNSFIKNFIEELSDYLNNANREEVNNMHNEIKSTNLEENNLYQVVDIGVNGVYLQNTKNDEIFEETNIPKELQEKLENDFILRYKNGEYIFEEKLTDEFFNSLVSIKEYNKINEQFIKESNILEIDYNTIFNVVSHKKDYSTLSYGKDNLLKVPTVLLPYFIDNYTKLKFEAGKFKKIF